MRLFSGKYAWQGLWLVAWGMLMIAPAVWAQSTSTINGRVLDQGDAVLPGVTVTATNANTGVARTTVSNAEGVYSMPGLEPGVYSVKTDLAGFASAARNTVTLGVNGTLTIDFTLRLAGVQESLTVTGVAPLIEVTQSKVAASIEATELENLPMITRTISGLMALLPGATPASPLHNSKETVGSVSYGGSSGMNVIPSVDGADNRDNQYGGPLMTFTTEGIEQFQLATNQFTAVDGRSAGAALTIVTKSGTNTLHGSGFLFARDQALSAKDYFSKRDNLDKLPYNRQQWGGSIGGPILRNRIFFFGAFENVNEESSRPVTDRLFRELDLLVPLGLANPNHPHAVVSPMILRVYSIKTNAQFNNNHSLTGRFAFHKNDRDSLGASPSNDQREPELQRVSLWSAVAQHNWVMGNRGLNQITGHVNNHYRQNDVLQTTGKRYLQNFPDSPLSAASLSFPTVGTGPGGSSGSRTDSYVIQIRDDVSLLAGTHAFKFGANYNRLPNLGVEVGNDHFPGLTFFDDPSVILSNSNGRYPQGFQTPGIVRQWAQGNRVLADGRALGAQQVMAWFQDDWRATPRLSLNLGVRYDRDFNFYDQRYYANNAARLVLEQIGSRYGGLPKTPTKNISPRVGFAYNVTGDGRRVIRGGYGLYFDQYSVGGTTDIMYFNKRPLGATSTLTNTAIGVGALATFRFGIDPLPAAPTEAFSLPRGTTGRWFDPNITDPYNHQVHIGYAHELAPNTVLSIDFTHTEGRKEFRNLEINPIVNGVRVLAPAFTQVFGVPNVLNSTRALSSESASEYNQLTFRFQRRFPRATLQAHYTLSGAYAYGGSIGSRAGSAQPVNQFEPFAPGEWGPTGNDERHRVVAMGVFDLPYGIQLSPVFQAATARPYNLTAGADRNADGTNNDRYIDPATGQEVSLNSARGDNTTVLDLRTTKFFALGGDRRIGLFVEVFNLFNTANFGSSYTGSSVSTNFREPTGFVAGVGYARQLQLGARFLF